MDAEVAFDGAVECFGLRGEVVETPGLCHPAPGHRVDNPGGDIEGSGEGGTADKLKRFSHLLKASRKEASGEAGTDDQARPRACGLSIDSFGLLVE